MPNPSQEPTPAVTVDDMIGKEVTTCESIFNSIDNLTVME
jgi:hypothetical protein